MVAPHRHPRGGAVEQHRLRSRRGFDQVRHPPGAVVDVQHMHLLARQPAGGVHQRSLNANAARVVDVRARQRGALDFRPEHESLHGIYLPRILQYRTLKVIHQPPPRHSPLIV
jgi:hypothetical protein